MVLFSPQPASSTQDPVRIQRIVSLGPINTENVFLLGAGDRLVGTTEYCNRPQAAQIIPKIGSVMQVSVEKIISLKPDLILATGLTSPQQFKKLRDLGLTVVQFGHPTSFDEICDQFKKLGELLGLTAKAEQIINRAKSGVNNVKALVSNSPLQKVFLQVGSSPLFGSVESSFTHDFIRLGGGTNIIDDQTSGTTNTEKVIAHNPDVIIVAIMGSETGIAAQEKIGWESISVLNAMQQNRIHIIDPNLVCSPSPVTFSETLRIIAGLIHPEINQKEFL